MFAQHPGGGAAEAIPMSFSGNRRQPTVPPLPPEDIRFLSARGFDIGRYISKGLYGYVYSGVCNERSTTWVKITAEEFEPNNDSNWFNAEKQQHFREVGLNGLPCAVKRMCRKDWTEKEHQEARLLMDLDHPNIVKVYQVYKCKENIYLIMEFMKGGTLGALLKNLAMDQKLDQMSATKIIQDVTAGLQHLHRSGFTHNDLHNDNVMLTCEDEQLSCKIVDFGNSKILQLTNQTEDISGVYSIVRQICDKTEFTDDRIKDGLNKFLDMIYLGAFSTMEEIGAQVFSLLRPYRATARPPPLSAVDRFAKWFKN